MHEKLDQVLRRCVLGRRSQGNMLREGVNHDEDGVIAFRGNGKSAENVNGEYVEFVSRNVMALWKPHRPLLVCLGGLAGQTRVHIILNITLHVGPIYLGGQVEICLVRAEVTRFVMAHAEYGWPHGDGDADATTTQGVLMEEQFVLVDERLAAWLSYQLAVTS